MSLERVPDRYARTPAMIFDAAVRERLVAGAAVLDVGSGRRPAVTGRDGLGRYVGLDVSPGELAAAPAGAYTDTVVADLTRRVGELVGGFDLVISRQVLEHVDDLGAALENLRAYLRPGGQLAAMLSGTYAVQSVLNRLLPAPLGVRLLRGLLGRDPASVFPAHYDRCHEPELTRLLEPWAAAAVTPIYQGGAYFNFSLVLRRAYFAYEDWAARTGRADLATHYLILARR
jgi:SAM-dependent methyltransferase